MSGRKRVNTNHKDFPAYKAEFEAIMQKDIEETAKAREKEGNGLDGESCSVQKKYTLMIKELQRKYSHIFTEELDDEDET